MQKELMERMEHSKSPYLSKIDKQRLQPMIEAFLKKENKRLSQLPSDERQLINWDSSLLSFFITQIKTSLNKITILSRTHDQFELLYQKAVTDEEKKLLLLNFSRKLGASDKDLKNDRQALGRWLDKEAMVERYKKQRSKLELQIILCLQRLEPLTKALLQSLHEKKFANHWPEVNLSETLSTLLRYDGNERVVVNALQAIKNIMACLPSSYRETFISHAMRFSILRAAFDPEKGTWVQCEAMSLIEYSSPKALLDLIGKRLNHPNAGDDFFVRSHAVSLLCRNASGETLNELIPVVLKDKSPYVRQTLAKHYTQLPNEILIRLLNQLALKDDMATVRAMAIFNSLDLVSNRDLFSPLVRLLKNVFSREEDEFVLRVTFKVIVNAHERLIKVTSDSAQTWFDQFNPCLNKKHLEAQSIKLRRWAAQAMEVLWYQQCQGAQVLGERLKNIIEKLKPGQTTTLPKSLLKETDLDLLGRVMAVMSITDFGLYLEPRRFRIKLTRGSLFGFRLWRLLYELSHPSSNKRQGFPYTSARISRGTIRAPSAILAEVTKTNVPGEPLVIDEEGGYRPYLPLMDDILSSLEQDKLIKLFTSEGITEIRPPKNPLKRLWAAWQLNLKFSQFARFRNWQESSSFGPKRYLAAFRLLGFKIKFKAYKGKSSDETVTRFFTGVSFTPILNQWDEFQNYFFTAYSNTLTELFLFSLVVLTYFIGRLFYTNWRVHRFRKNIPLIIGGYGTRGKSGVERMKAAMLSALGYNVLSKTTGSEAMFLHGSVLSRTHEFNLFRPYEKASIWEQVKLLTLARKMDVDIFLWECMGLTPTYIEILQRQWTKDDLSTITNTYPDHEDIQGPAGINVAESMTYFINPGSKLITSEQEMLPILAEGAKQLNTDLITVDWINAGFVTPDILERFPYEEHPVNVALVLKLGEILGIEPSFALKAFTDRLHPDIGAFKVFPPAPMDSRTLIFVNAMSANERYGCLKSWEKLNLHQHDPYQHPDEWLTTLVNNRADRVNRSQVFAEMIVEDLNVDQHILVGSNIRGLQGYLDKAWNDYESNINLWPDKTTQSAEEYAIQYAKRMRIAYEKETVKKRLQAMLNGINPNAKYTIFLKSWDSIEQLSQVLNESDFKPWHDAILKTHQRNLNHYHQFESFLDKVNHANKSEHKTLNQTFKNLMREWFFNKIFIIERLDASGDYIHFEIQQLTPPGYKNTIVGIQNIKGPGLEVVRDWLTWETCYEACEKTKQKNAALIKEGLDILSEFDEFNLLCDEYVHGTLKNLKERPIAQKEWYQMKITAILARLEHSMNEIKQQIQTESKTHWRAALKSAITRVFDIYKGLQRRRIADQIYDDLANGRISSTKAILELQKLNRSQSI
ncbi:HEAT repeat domain-containing protein [Legionella impletisoli]|uniref:Capsule biosynthesis protein CapB n=1 Tax=Legionella impletisoli TaxID=343510 RepID=A0A917JVK8_9GAMM|nr:HEAT repeat domain-containing protein [Legionella impletisoli]GGI88150.1 hypothetical protein GCM10007966_16100 [Legionella impletisoli]